MTRNEKRFGVIGTIGNGSVLLPAPRNRSFHVFERKRGEERKEIAIRNDRESAIDLAAEVAERGDSIVSVMAKPILTELPL